MKHMKVFVLAALAAMGLMAFVGAGTASATTLCTTADSPGCTMAYTAGTTIDLSLKKGTSAKLTSPKGTVVATCTGLTIKGTTNITSTAKGTPFPVPIKVFEWSGCSQKTETVADGELDTEWIEGTHNGAETGAGSQVTVEIFGVSCTYGDGTGTALGTLVGGEEPEDNIEATVTKTAGGFLCPATTIWDATVVVTEPHALFLTN